MPPRSRHPSWEWYSPSILWNAHGKPVPIRTGTLRAAGALLVSADLKGGIISGVKITSEKGGECIIANPWPEKSVGIIRNGIPAEAVTGPRFTLKTTVDEIIELK